MIGHSGKMTFGTHSAIGKLFTGISVSPGGLEIWKYGKRQRVNYSKNMAGLKAYRRRYARGRK